MRDFDKFRLWSHVTSARSIFLALALCVVAGCSNSRCELEALAYTAGIRFPSDAKIEEYVGLEPGFVDGPASYFMIVTDAAGFRSTVATLPKSSRDWRKKRDNGDSWSALSTTDRLDISDQSQGAKNLGVPEPPPSWWHPDSIGKFTASRGNEVNRYWSFIGGKDTSGRYVIYAFYVKT